MSSKTDQYKTTIVAGLLFTAILLVAAWFFQSFVVTPAFRSTIMSFFAPDEVKAHFHETPEFSENFIADAEFILDMTSEARVADTKVGEIDITYNKPGGITGQWVIFSEKLGEDPIMIQPQITFGIFSLFFGFVVAILITALLPRQLGYVSNKIEREIQHTINRIDDQTGDKISREEIERITAASSNDDLTAIEKEFGPVIVDEIEDVRAANRWKRNRILVFKGLRLYMVRHFSEKYSNNVQGFAYGGAAILIVVIGIRGLKFIPPTQPSILLAAITLEFTMLTLLAVTLFYTEEEQRMDKLIRDLEESSEGQKFELINLVRTSQQQQRDLASMVDYIQRQTGDLKRMADALTGANKEYIVQVAQRAVAEYITQERSEEITEKVIRERIESAMRQMFSGNTNLPPSNG